MTTGEPRPPPVSSVLVWDVPVRAFHWLLVAAVAAAAGTGFLGGMTTLRIHLIAGVAVAALVMARVVWGVVGPTHARFASFAYGPRAPSPGTCVTRWRGGCIGISGTIRWARRWCSRCWWCWRAAWPAAA